MPDTCISPKPCKHLDYETEYINCTIQTCAPDFPEIRYWRREAPHIAREGLPDKVQFCKQRGRINSVFDCYTGAKWCYEREGESDA